MSLYALVGWSARLVTIGLLLCVALLYVEYKTTQFPNHRAAALLVDFPSFLLSFVARPIVRRFFTIEERDWNRDREVEGLHNPVDIYRDDMGIPYIFAHDEHDAHVAQLIIEYTERPFQCEFLRRLAAGRLSETFGEQMFSSDYRARLLVDADSLRYRMENLTSQQKALFNASVQEFAALGWKHTEWKAIEYVQMLEMLYLLFERGFAIEFSKTALQKHLKEYWPSFDVDHLRAVPYLNYEGEFPSIYDQQGNRQSLPPPLRPTADHSWAKWRPADAARMIAKLRRAQGGGDSASEEQQTQQQQPHEFAADGGAAGASETTQRGTGNNEAPASTGAAAATAGSADGLSNTAAAIGSNAWAVSGRFTASGKPVLASDTHLNASAPGFWMPTFISVGPSDLLTTQKQQCQKEEFQSFKDNQVKTDGDEDREVERISADTVQQEQQRRRVTGVSAVGLGMICVGHSEYGAWGQTMALTDAADLFLITLNNAGTHYKYDGAWYPLRTRVEEFSVQEILKSVKIETKVLRYTHHGPLISDALPVFQKFLGPHEAVALASVAARAPISAEYFSALTKARTWQDFIAAGGLDQQIGLTTVWATVAGDIGGTVGGAVPIRTRWENRSAIFRSGSSSAEDWQGILPQTKIANAVNPKIGFVGMANSKLSRDINGLYGESFRCGFRQRRVTEILQKLTRKGGITVEDMIEMQNDVHTIHGREFRDFVLRTMLFAYKQPPATADTVHDQEQQKEEAEQQRIKSMCKNEGLLEMDGNWLYETMANWENADMSSDSVAATVYEVWAQWVLQTLSKMHAFPEEALELLLGQSPDIAWMPTVEIGTHWPYNLLRALRRNEKVIADVTTPERLLCSSAAAALAWLRKRYGEDSSQWKWGLVRSCFVEHPLATAFPVLRHTASVGPLRWGGSATTIKAHTSLPAVMSLEKPWQKDFAFSGMASVLRMVVDLGDLKKSYWSVLPGVSGWVGSGNYANFASNIEATAGTAHMRPMLWTDEQIAAAAVTHMRLLPKTLPCAKEKRDELNFQALEEL